MKQTKHKHTPIVITITLLLSLIIGVPLLMCGTASAWYGDYGNRMNITINNTDGSSLSYQPYNFSIDTAALVSAGKMFANGSDVEITTDADVILKWWNETDFDDASTKIWVNGTSLSNTANTTHHIYYNKSSDVVFDGNISATFDYGEDFEYGSVGYDLIANTDWVNVVTPNKFETATISKRGKYSGNQSSSGGDGRMQLDIPNYPLASEKFCYEYDWYVSSTSSYQMIDMMEAASTGVTLGMGIISAGVLSHVISGSWYDITTCPATTWHKMKVVIDPTANTYDLFMNGTQVLTGSGLRAFSPPADMYINVATIFGYTDNIFLREYHDNNIKVYLGSEETAPTGFTPISISSPSPSPSATKYVSNKTVTYSATPSKTADNKWSYGNGTFIEWDNSTTTPSTTLWINSSETKYFNISLTAYATGNNSDNASQSWNNSITDNMFDSTNYTWARWDELDLEGWIGSLGNIEIGDVDNDGADEMVIIGSIQGGSYNNRDVIFYDLDGTKTRYNDVTSPNYVFTEASIHDVTEDGINELLCIYAYESPDGISDLYRFNISSLNGSNLNNDVMTSGSNNPKSISWIDINNNEHYYSCGCGAGETVNCYTTLSSHSASEIDDFGISAEDNIAWDIDNDGQMELLVVEGWASNAAKIWMYEINNATGAYTSKTMLFDNSSVGGTHYSAAIHTGDIDNDGIDNLIIHWEGGASFWSESYRIEAYEFDGITNFGEGNFSEGFVVDATSKYCARGHGKTFVADVDNDGLNELVTGGHTAMSVYPYPVTLDYYDITGGASITKNEIMNCSVAYMGGVSYDAPSITPAFISQGKVVVSVGKDRTSGVSLENEIYVLESVNILSTYTPPNPTTLANTTSNFWVNHTWSAGSGNVTDSYNVSQNNTWHNTTTTPHFNATSVGAHGYSDITVYAYNTSGTGTLSAGNITQNTTVPNNAVTITNTSDWSGSPGSNVYVDYDATDADSDTPTFSCNRTDLFTDFSTSTGKGNWTATAGTYYVDFGVSDGYGSTSNYTMTITGGAVAPIITLIAQNPSTIFQNTTGYLNISYGISHDSSGLNNTSVSFIFRNYDHTSNDANHSIRPPANDKCEMWNFDGQIIRGANRNETLNFENNDTITGGDIFTWSGMDENNTRLTIVPVNSTYTVVHINGTIHDLAMEQMWYLDRTDMVESPKTQLAIHKTQDVLIKFWNAEIFKGNYDFIGMGYTDTSLESSPAAHPSDANPVSFYYLPASYDPLGGFDPLVSAVFMGSLNATQWIDHVYSPDQNASYVRGAINNTLLNSVINTTEISYLYFRSNTPSSKPFYINITDSSTNTNRTFGQTDVLWIGDAAPYTAHPYTPNVWFAFVYDNTSFDHKLYAADNNDKWGNGTLQSTNIGAGLFPPTKPSINHFHFNGSDDYNINKTYSGTIEVYIGVGTDPDGGTVTHNLTLHYKNQTLVAIINNTFTDADIIGNGVYAEISFNTTPYYSETEEYTLRVIATDDEGETSESWSCCNFTLGTHQISNLHTTTLVYNRIVWEWVNPDYYDTIMVYLDNVWKQNTTGTYYSASSLSQQTAYTIKLITVYAGVESDPATDTRVTPAEQGGSGGGGGDTTPAPTPTATATATATITPLPDENVTENVSIAIEPIPDITTDIVMNETVHATVWHLSLGKHGVYIPYQQNIVACTAIPPYACRYYEDQKKFEIVIDGESQNPIFTADQWITFITRDGERISQHIRTKVYNPLFYLTFTPTSASVTGVMRYFVHGDENTMDGIRVWWIILLLIGGIGYYWRRKK